MYKVDAQALQKATSMMQQMVMLEKIPASFQQMDAEIQNNTKVWAVELLPILAPLPVPATKLAVQELQHTLDTLATPVTYNEVIRLTYCISETLRRELQTVKLYALDSSKAEFYEPIEPLFGAEVASKFPSIRYDIDQAGKCFSCDLTTASVFHTVRSLEAGLRAIEQCLGISAPTTGVARNWSNITNDIRDEMEKRWPQKTGRMNGDARLFDEVFGALKAIQNPYRNATMHLDATYNSSEALHLFELVKGLMQRIASRMDENGDPKA